MTKHFLKISPQLNLIGKIFLFPRQRKVWLVKCQKWRVKKELTFSPSAYIYIYIDDGKSDPAGYIQKTIVVVMLNISRWVINDQHKHLSNQHLFLHWIKVGGPFYYYSFKKGYNCTCAKKNMSSRIIRWWCYKASQCPLKVARRPSVNKHLREDKKKIAGKKYSFSTKNRRDLLYIYFRDSCVGVVYSAHDLRADGRWTLATRDNKTDKSENDIQPQGKIRRVALPMMIFSLYIIQRNKYISREVS